MYKYNNTLAGKIDDFIRAPTISCICVALCCIHTLHIHTVHCHTCTLSHLYVIRLPGLHTYTQYTCTLRCQSGLSKEGNAFEDKLFATTVDGRKRRKGKKRRRRCFLRKLRQRFPSKDSFLFTAYSKDDVLSNDQRKYSTIHQVFLYSSVVEVYLLRPEVTSCYTSTCRNYNPVKASDT